MTGAIIAGLAAGALWGLVFIAPKWLPGFTAWEVTMGRYAAYGALCLVVASSSWRRFRPVLRPRHVATAAGLAILSNSLYYVLLVVGVRDAGVALTGLVIGTIPLWLAMLGRFEAHTVQPALRRLALPMVLIAAGIGLVNLHALNAPSTDDGRFGWGLAAAVGALACWTAYPYLNARYLKRHPDIDNVAWTNLIGLATLFGLVVSAPFFYTPADPVTAPDRSWTAFAGWCAAMGIGSSWIATWLWNHASARLPVALTGQLIVSETLFALLYGFLYHGRWPHPTEWMAIAAFSSGILLAIRAYR